MWAGRAEVGPGARGGSGPLSCHGLPARCGVKATTDYRYLLLCSLAMSQGPMRALLTVICLKPSHSALISSVDKNKSKANQREPPRSRQSNSTTHQASQLLLRKGLGVRRRVWKKAFPFQNEVLGAPGHLTQCQVEDVSLSEDPKGLWDWFPWAEADKERLACAASWFRTPNHKCLSL